MIKKTLLTISACALIQFFAFPQFKLSADFRPRAEFRDGYQTLSEPGEKGVFLITQRTRLNASFKDKNKIESFLSFQDIRTWGQFNLNTTASTVNLYQAWVKFNVVDRLRLKLGRQEFEYDDLKILSNSTWRLQARTHDAALLEWQSADSSFQVHLAGGVNNAREVQFQTAFNDAGYYKNMGMVWLNKKFESTELSFLFLDLGRQLADTTINHFKTIGIYGVQRFGDMKLTGSFYLQRGENQADQNVAASMAALQLQVPLSQRFSLTGGFDVLSGTSAENLQDPTFNETNSFIPLYARRHRYFGIQDMFYAGGFNVPGGLADYFLKFRYKVSDKWSTAIHAHSFSTRESIFDTENSTITDDKHLGYELDTFVTYKPYSNMTVSFAYTHFFATESMRILKQRGDEDELAHFAYLQLSYTPTLFSK
ncbi:alginate export family protein [Ekhidna sp. To15]|uniref:alginate export family protein n=1 Tax=Ekhidna sp. To15 TaxID=3395267 RepID=UPI003F51B708